MADLERDGNGRRSTVHQGRSHLPPIYNWLSIIGAIMTAVGGTALAFFVVIDLVSLNTSGYMGVTFLPPLGLALVGIALVVSGYVREKLRRKKGSSTRFTGKWHINVRDRLKDMKFVAMFLAGTTAATFVILLGGASSLWVVEFTSSNTFCAEVCHTVMGPEATVYSSSAHSRIDCVECHVGPGGDSFIRSKISGARRLYEFAIDHFNRPIPTPIDQRRPSRDMCESCHQSERFIDYKVITRNYFLGDEENTPVNLRMMVKVGGPRNGLMQGSGIHQHMVAANKVEYIASDPQRQQIAWVRVTRADGTVSEFNDTDDPLTDAEREALPVRTMECLDCHSRPAHEFKAPVNTVNQAIAAGLISRDLPYIKAESVRHLDQAYSSQGEAMVAIDEGLRSFYKEEHPEVFEAEQDALAASIEAVQSIYRTTIFPEMRAKWTAHPNNIGHRDSPGCFRCHNDVMESEEGDTIFSDCTKCHVNLAQGESVASVEADFDNGNAFVHPEDDDTFEEFVLCTDCHTGGVDIY
jgi:hypothetical protein